MNRSSLYSFIGVLTNDPNHDRYTTTDIDTFMDSVQGDWNIAANIVRDTVNVTLSASTGTYNLSNLTGTPLKFLRVTHNGVDLTKRSKEYFDLYVSNNWATTTGTPADYYIDLNTTTPKIGVRPIPDSAAAAYPLVVEYVKEHTSMASDSDTPWMNGTTANTLVTNYHEPFAYDVAASLLERDPTAENMARIAGYRKQADAGLSDMVQQWGALDIDEPYRFKGGRNWKY